MPRPTHTWSHFHWVHAPGASDSGFFILGAYPILTHPYKNSVMAKLLDQQPAQANTQSVQYTRAQPRHRDGLHSQPSERGGGSSLPSGPNSGHSIRAVLTTNRS